jgi:tRNA threonylcarbamoyladenosine biosynthesis protein TsaB
MAYQLKDFFDDDHLLCPMIDARRMEVYCEVLKKSSTDSTSLQTIQNTEAKIIDQDSFLNYLELQKMVFFGDGASKCQPILGQHPNAIFVNTEVYPSAKTIGFLATTLLANNQTEDLVTFEPFYLKDFFVPTKKS